MATEQTATTAATPPQPAPEAPISQVEAIRQAEAELGRKATRARIQAFAKDRYGLDLTAKYVTDTRSKLHSKSKKKKKKKPAAAKPAATAAKPAAARPAVVKQATKKKPAPPAPARPVPQPGRSGATVLLDDLQAVQSLLKRVGPTQLRAMIDVLSK